MGLYSCFYIVNQVDITMWICAVRKPRCLASNSTHTCCLSHGVTALLRKSFSSRTPSVIAVNTAA